MRNVTLTVMGIVGLSLLLCGSGEVWAQTDRTEVSPGAPGTAGSSGAGAPGADLQQSVLQLQSEVAQLRQELAQVRAELANVKSNTGAGGSGQTGITPAAAPTGVSAGQRPEADRTSTQGAVSGETRGQGTAPQGGTSPGTAQSGTQAGDTSASGYAVVNAIYTGKLRSVSSKQLVLLDDRGQPFTVELDTQTRFISKGQRISAEELKQGTRVRATVDLLSGRNQAMEITTLPER